MVISIKIAVFENRDGSKGEEVAYKLDFVIRLERYRLATAK